MRLVENNAEKLGAVDNGRLVDLDALALEARLLAPPLRLWMGCVARDTVRTREKKEGNEKEAWEKNLGTLCDALYLAHFRRTALLLLIFLLLPTSIVA